MAIFLSADKRPIETHGPFFVLLILILILILIDLVSAQAIKIKIRFKIKRGRHKLRAFLRIYFGPVFAKRLGHAEHGTRAPENYDAPEFYVKIALMPVETTKARQADPVIQFSVFTPNRLGRLHDLIRLFGARSVHVLALMVLDTTDSAIIRIVVDDPDKARDLLYPAAA